MELNDSQFIDESIPSSFDEQKNTQKVTTCESLSKLSEDNGEGKATVQMSISQNTSLINDKVGIPEFEDISSESDVEEKANSSNVPEMDSIIAVLNDIEDKVDSELSSVQAGQDDKDADNINSSRFKPNGESDSKNDTEHSKNVEIMDSDKKEDNCNDRMDVAENKDLSISEENTSEGDGSLDGLSTNKETNGHFSPNKSVSFSENAVSSVVVFDADDEDETNPAPENESPMPNKYLRKRGTRNSPTKQSDSPVSSFSAIDLNDKKLSMKITVVLDRLNLNYPDDSSDSPVKESTKEPKLHNQARSEMQSLRSLRLFRMKPQTPSLRLFRLKPSGTSQANGCSDTPSDEESSEDKGWRIAKTNGSNSRSKKLRNKRSRDSLSSETDSSRARRRSNKHSYCELSSNDSDCSKSSSSSEDTPPSEINTTPKRRSLSKRNYQEKSSEDESAEEGILSKSISKRKLSVQENLGLDVSNSEVEDKPPPLKMRKREADKESGDDKKLRMEIKVVLDRMSLKYLKESSGAYLLTKELLKTLDTKPTKSKPKKTAPRAKLKSHGKEVQNENADNSSSDESSINIDLTKHFNDSKLKTEVRVVLDRICSTKEYEELVRRGSCETRHWMRTEAKENNFSSEDDNTEKGTEDEDSDDSETSSVSSREKKKSPKKSKKNPEEGSKAITGRKNIRALISDNCLKVDTKAATKAEEERKQRIKERYKMYGDFLKPEYEESGKPKSLVLDIDSETREKLVEVHPDLVSNLKPHQIKGIQFIWESTIESVNQLKDSTGSGCILAHSMGLGKTLQIIAFLHTVMTSKFTKDFIKTALVICPYNTVLNWENEFKQWLNRDELALKVYHLLEIKEYKQRALHLKDWQNSGGVMIMGYSLFRLLTYDKSRRIARKWRDMNLETLVYPGADIVVCDEGHILKSGTSSLSKAVSRIKTLRRIALTGTPLQNNLQEYHSMVHFVKPHLLGTLKEFRNRFINPIMNGQCADSTPDDFKLMKKRVHILHTLLEACVQRFDYSVLTPYLPPKHEYIISVRMSELQVKLYMHYLENYAKKPNSTKNAGSGGANTLFVDYNILKDIWTHPYLLSRSMLRKGHGNSEDESEYFSDDLISPSDKEDVKETDEDSDDDFSLEEDDSYDIKTKHTKQIQKEVDEVVRQWKTKSRSEIGESSITVEEVKAKRWWNEFIDDENDETNIYMSGKFVVLFDIIRECEIVGDKIIVFSQTLSTLELIEKILERITSETGNCQEDALRGQVGTWIEGMDYFRLDGSTSVEVRQKYIDAFNDANDRSRLFLISTRAGSLGTNLVGANRVVILDASWNPVHDVQAIFRVFRFGQTKPVYVYRLLAQGSMEEKIYDRQVTKESLSFRVVDEKQTERHFNAADLQELYTFDPESHNIRPIPIVPKDDVLADMLIRHSDWIVAYHEHDSLLQKAPDDDLTEEERKAAWIEYEAEREGLTKAATNKIQQQNAERLLRSAENLKHEDARQKLKDNLAKIIQDITNKQPDISQINLNRTFYKALSNTRWTYMQQKNLLVRHKKRLESERKPIPPNVSQRLAQTHIVLQELMKYMKMLQLNSKEIRESMKEQSGKNEADACNNRSQNLVDFLQLQNTNMLQKLNYSSSLAQQSIPTVMETMLKSNASSVDPSKYLNQPANVSVQYTLGHPSVMLSNPCGQAFAQGGTSLGSSTAISSPSFIQARPLETARQNALVTWRQSVATKPSQQNIVSLPSTVQPQMIASSLSSQQFGGHIQLQTIAPTQLSQQKSIVANASQNCPVSLQPSVRPQLIESPLQSSQHFTTSLQAQLIDSVPSTQLYAALVQPQLNTSTQPSQQFAVPVQPKLICSTQPLQQFAAPLLQSNVPTVQSQWYAQPSSQLVAAPTSVQQPISSSVVSGIWSPPCFTNSTSILQAPSTTTFNQQCNIDVLNPSSNYRATYQSLQQPVNSAGAAESSNFQQIATSTNDVTAAWHVEPVSQPISACTLVQQSNSSSVQSEVWSPRFTNHAPVLQAAAATTHKQQFSANVSNSSFQKIAAKKPPSNHKSRPIKNIDALRAAAPSATPVQLLQSKVTYQCLRHPSRLTETTESKHFHEAAMLTNDDWQEQDAAEKIAFTFLENFPTLANLSSDCNTSATDCFQLPPPTDADRLQHYDENLLRTFSLSPDVPSTSVIDNYDSYNS